MQFGRFMGVGAFGVVAALAHAQGSIQDNGVGLSQPASATMQVRSLNGVLHADMFPGTDIGAKVNAAIAQRAGSCGTVDIAPGSYTFSTQILKPRCLTLEGNNAQLTFTGAPMTPAIVTGTVNGTGADYTQGGIRNLTVLGRSTSNGSVGIWHGGLGTATGYAVPAKVQDYLETFVNVHAMGFGIGEAFGSEVFQMSWIGSSSTSNRENLQIMSPFGSENMNFYGFECLNAVDHCMYAPDMAGAVYNFVSSSFDYNVGGAFYTMNGDLHLNGGHLEQANNAIPFDEPDTDGAANLQGMRLWIGGAMNFVFGGVNLPGIVRVYGWNSQVTVADGIAVYAPGKSKIASFVNWGVEGYSGTLLIGQYWNPTSPGGVNFPAYSLIAKPAPSGTRNPPAFYRYHTYTQYAPTGTVVSSESILSGSINTYPGYPGVIGGTRNYDGALPPVPGAADSPMPGGGGFVGWNAEQGTPGEADWFNTYPGQNGNTDGHAFWVLNNHSWNQVGGFTRGGRAYAPHGMRVMPTGSSTVVDGYTGTCAAGTTLTVVGGVITGCQ